MRFRTLDIGLLVLRLGVGLSLLILFGMEKLKAGSGHLFSGQPWAFIDFNQKIGLPAPALIAYIQTLNESVVALFVACGFLFRISAPLLALGFAAAVLCGLKASENILLAGYFCLMFVSLTLTGPGKFSVDYFLKSRK